MNFTVFLDRDGVINVDSPDYIKDESEFYFIDGSAEAIALLTENNFDIIIITNQSALGRGMLSPKQLDAIFKKMKTGINGAGGKIKDIFFCPHTPDYGCTCRKPLPGMILKAVKKYGINTSLSAMIGDSTKDIMCARNAGCGYAILVHTGNGIKSAEELKKMNTPPDFGAGNLMEAARWLLQNINHN